MTTTKQIGISYQAWEFENGKKTLKEMFEALPGNSDQAFTKIRKWRAKAFELSNNRTFVNIAMWTMVYGFTIRLLIAI